VDNRLQLDESSALAELIPVPHRGEQGVVEALHRVQCACTRCLNRAEQRQTGQPEAEPRARVVDPGGTEFGVDRRIDPMLRASLFCRSAGILFLNPAATSSRLKYSGFANKILDATRMRKGLYQRGVEPSADAWCATCISE
jgi:hypothetical protein